MVSGSVVAWPLFAVGVLVAVAFYLALGYLALAGARLAVVLVRRTRAQARSDRRAREFGGHSQPTLLDVAVARSQESGAWPVARAGTGEAPPRPFGVGERSGRRAA